MIAFQHRSDVRRIIMDEFDLPMASEILREAKCEADEVREELFRYEKLVRRAEKLLLYGQSEPEEE